MTVTEKKRREKREGGNEETEAEKEEAEQQDTKTESQEQSLSIITGRIYLAAWWCSGTNQRSVSCFMEL